MLEEEPHTDTGRTCKITQTITQGQDRSGDPGAVRLECYPMYHHATIFLFRVHVVNLLTSTNTILHVCFTLLTLNMRRDWSGRIKKKSAFGTRILCDYRAKFVWTTHTVRNDALRVFFCVNCIAFAH